MSRNVADGLPTPSKMIRSFGTYARYKQATNRFLDWLATDANHRGSWTIQAIDTAVRNKAVADQDDRHNATNSLREAIKIREEVARRYEVLTKKMVDCGLESSNRGHQHFILCLKNWLRLLSPQPHAKTQTRNPLPDLAREPSGQDVGLGSRFKGLEVEEAELDNSDEVTAEASAARRLEKELEVGEMPNETLDLLNEVEASLEKQDAFVACMGALMDLTELMECVEATWTKYQQKQSTFMGAVGVTQVAFDIVRTIAADLERSLNVPVVTFDDVFEKCKIQVKEHVWSSQGQRHILYELKGSETPSNQDEKGQQESLLDQLTEGPLTRLWMLGAAVKRNVIVRLPEVVPVDTEIEGWPSYGEEFDYNSKGSRSVSNPKQVRRNDFVLDTDQRLCLWILCSVVSHDEPNPFDFDILKEASKLYYHRKISLPLVFLMESCTAASYACYALGPNQTVRITSATRDVVIPRMIRAVESLVETMGKEVTGEEYIQMVEAVKRMTEYLQEVMKVKGVYENQPYPCGAIMLKATILLLQNGKFFLVNDSHRIFETLMYCYCALRCSGAFGNGTDIQVLHVLAQAFYNGWLSLQRGSLYESYIGPGRKSQTNPDLYRKMKRAIFKDQASFSQKTSSGSGRTRRTPAPGWACIPKTGELSRSLKYFWLGVPDLENQCDGDARWFEAVSLTDALKEAETAVEHDFSDAGVLGMNLFALRNNARKFLHEVAEEQEAQNLINKWGETGKLAIENVEQDKDFLFEAAVQAILLECDEAKDTTSLRPLGDCFARHVPSITSDLRLLGSFAL